ncbi:MAG: hypothetical protein IOC66_33705 [Burkholderia sp.]|nr:hypothetical protein [Burkholderia sp.]
MPAYTNLPNALVAVGAKPFATTLQALRDNPLAIAEGDSLAPVNAGNWHPFNKVTNSDANTGRIWSQAVDGAVAAVTTPDFADGWDYAFLFDRVAHSSAGAQNLRFNLFRETSGVYAGAANHVSIPTGFFVAGFFEIQNARLTRAAHLVSGISATSVLGDAVILSSSVSFLGVGAAHATAQKILRAQISFSGGNITGTGAAIYMLRRRNVAT